MLTPKSGASRPIPYWVPSTSRINVWWSACLLVGVAVAIKNPKAWLKIGLTKEAIKVTVRSRLRAGRIYGDPALATTVLVVLVIGDPVVFGIEADYFKLLKDEMTGVTQMARTWWRSAVGSHAKDSNAVLSAVSQYTDKFIDEYLRVNEEACDRRRIPGTTVERREPLTGFENTTDTNIQDAADAAGLHDEAGAAARTPHTGPPHGGANGRRTTRIAARHAGRPRPSPNRLRPF